MIWLILMTSIVSEEPSVPVIETGEVLVTATHLKEKGSSFVTVVDGDRLQGESLGSALSRMEGINAMSYGGYGSLSIPSIRGSSYNQVLVLIDGVKVNNAEVGGFDLSAVPPGDIARIEVLRGGGSSIYGADALGGVINVITRHPGAGPSTTASASYGSYNSGSLVMSQQGRVRTGDYLASVSARGSEGSYPYKDIQGNPARMDNNSNVSLGFLGKGGAPIGEAVRLEFSGDLFGSDVKSPGSLAFPTPKGRRTDMRGLLNISMRMDGRPRGGETGVKAYFLGQTEEYYDNKYVMESKKNIFRNYGTGATLRSEGSVGRHSLYGFLEGRDEFADSTAIGRKGRTTGAVYVNDTMDPFHGYVQVPVSLRLDWTSDFGAAWNPRVGILIVPVPPLSLKGNVGTSFRAPTFDDLYWPPDAFSVGNPSLRPEKAVNYDAGAELRIGGLSAETAFFRNNVRDLIQWTPGAGEGGRWSPVNISTAVLQGIEAGITFTTPHTDLRGSYTFLSAENGERIPLFYRPAHKAYGKVSIREGMVSGFADILFVSFRYTDITAQNFLPGYWTGGAGASVTWRGFEFRGQMKRVFDEAFHPLLTFQEVYGYPIPGITWEFGVTWKR